MQNRIDLFTLVHKGIRWWLGSVSATLGAAEVTSRGFVAQLDAVADLLAGLDEHARHEDTFIAPVLRLHAPERATAWAAEHHAFEQAERELRAMLAKLRDLDPSDGAARVAVLALYRAFNRFTADMLLHLDREETELMPLLWARCSDAELAAIMTSFKAQCGVEAASFYRRNAAAYTQSERVLLGV
jgi:hypothetical protein